MAVLAEGLSVIIRGEAIIEKFEGGWEGFIGCLPTTLICSDSNIVSVQLRNLDDVSAYIDVLCDRKLEFITLDQKFIDIAVADQQIGLTGECDWLEFGYAEFRANEIVPACWLLGSGDDAKDRSLKVPENWDYKGSLSSEAKFDVHQVH